MLSGEYNNYFSEKEFIGDGYHISPMHFFQLRWILETAGFRIDKITSNQFTGLINTSGLNIFLSSLLMLPLRSVMKPKDRSILEGDILIIKAVKVK
jgi:hypothetical protein